MNQEVAPVTEPAHPSLRERRRIETIDLITEAVLAVLEERGIDGFSVEAVATRVGISVRTVYRYFPDRAALLEAALRVDDERYPYRPPRTPDEIASVYEVLFALFDQRPALTRAVLTARVSGALRWAGRTERLGVMGQALASVTDNLPEAEAHQATAVIVYLANSLAWLSLADESGLDGAEAGAAIAWAIRTLIADLDRRNRDAPHSPE